MDIVSFAIKKPVAVIVGVILVVLFGVIGLWRMPYQLSPDVTEPEITVTTLWPGATPYEVEREIIEEQEKVLKGIPGLVEMESSSFNNLGSVTLKFEIGTLVDDALLRVSNKINEVSSYPVNVEKPVINATGAATSPVIWMILKTEPGNPAPARTFRTYFENELRQHLERVEGVADLFIGGGTEREMHIVVDPEALAAYDLTVDDIMRTVSAENVNISAGIMGLERRDYRIRTVGEFNSPGEIERVVVKSTGQTRVLLGDVAAVSYGYERPEVAMLHNGKEGIAIGIKPQSGVNILEMTDRVEQVVTRLNTEKLKGQGIYLDWVYDQRPYINGAIGLVKQDILIGGVLAIMVLLIFLRSISATIVIAISILISILGSFVVMSALGRNLNVISLAGISFAVGILVDNFIVVLENIDRHKKLGKSPFDASYEGAKEVWGAVLASTVTNVAVFLPVIFMKEEAGQLFMDIAIAITTSVSLSLAVSVLVVPMLSKQLYTLAGEAKEGAAAGQGILVRAGARMAGLMMVLVNAAIRNTTTRLVTVLSMTSLAVLSVILLFPKMEYLPQGNRNLIINILVAPPGLSYTERQAIGEQLFTMAAPYIGKEQHEGVPGIKNMFYVGSDQIMLFGAISTQEQNASGLIPLFTRFIFSIPGMFGISNQAGIFQTNLGRGRTIDVDITGEDLDHTVSVGGMMFGMIKQRIPEAQIRPIPSLELLYPEVRVIPERERLKAAGLSAADLGVALDVMMDGRRIGSFNEVGQKKIDLVMKASGERIETPEELYASPVVTDAGQAVPVSSLSSLVRTYGIPQIRHLERRRTVTLQITPPLEMPLQEAMEMIENSVTPELRAMGMLEATEVSLSGAADKLTETRRALQWNFLLAALITYLLMSALFGNFIYPFLIMFTVPLAASGGFIGLKLVNLLIAPQPLDILTMLGFVILVGVVVNNAILIVHQALNNIRFHGMEHMDAVLDSTRTRLRPIYMAATISIFGLLPLVVAPGPGSELYRGLGSVVLGGLAISTVFTVFLMPALLAFVIKMEKVGEEGQADRAKY